MKKRTKAELEVRFGKPHDGRIEVLARHDYQKLKFRASYGAADPIGELVYCLLKTLDGSARAEVIWVSKPYNYQFVFERHAEGRQLTIRQIAELKTTAPGMTLFTLRGTAYQILRPFWKALRDLEADQLIEKYERGTARRFPLNELRRLGEKVVALR